MAKDYLCFLRRLSSFNICRKTLRMRYESYEPSHWLWASALPFAVTCWSSRQQNKKHDKIIHKASDVLGVELDLLSLGYKPAECYVIFLACLEINKLVSDANMDWDQSTKLVDFVSFWPTSYLHKNVHNQVEQRWFAREPRWCFSDSDSTFPLKTSRFWFRFNTPQTNYASQLPSSVPLSNDDTVSRWAPPDQPITFGISGDVTDWLGWSLCF